MHLDGKIERLFVDDFKDAQALDRPLSGLCSGLVASIGEKTDCPRGRNEILYSLLRDSRRQEERRVAKLGQGKHRDEILKVRGAEYGHSHGLLI